MTVAKMPFTVRDRQRARFYAVESQFELYWKTDHPRRRQPTTRLTWAQVTALCERLYDDAMERPYPHQFVLARRRTPLLIEKARSRQARSAAWPHEGRIVLAPTQCTLGFAIHEVAHLVAGGLHGWRYALVYRRMMGRHLHVEAEQLLKQLYAWSGVRDRTRGMCDDDVPPYRMPPSARARMQVMWATMGSGACVDGAGAVVGGADG